MAGIYSSADSCELSPHELEVLRAAVTRAIAANIGKTDLSGLQALGHVLSCLAGDLGDDEKAAVNGSISIRLRNR